MMYIDRYRYISINMLQLYHTGTLPWLKMDHFTRLVLLSGLQSAPNMALARSLMPDLEDWASSSWGLGSRWPARIPDLRRTYVFFFFLDGALDTYMCIYIYICIHSHTQIYIYIYIEIYNIYI